MDLKSSDTETLRRAQDKICAQSIIFNEIRKEHAGYDMPFIAYTHNREFGDELQEHQEELDNITMSGDLFDSLRRRHIALSHTILPQQISELAQELKIPLKVANLGSGVGLDLLNVLQNFKGHAVRVDNYDVNPASLALGRRLVEHLCSEGLLPVDYITTKNP
jgi:hypothetical protein